MSQVRVCDLCGGIDDHPRHLVNVAQGDGQVAPAILQRAARELPEDEAGQAALAQLMDTTTQARHMDCCGENGCGVCQEVMAAAGKKRGAALRKHINGGK